MREPRNNLQRLHGDGPDDTRRRWHCPLRLTNLYTGFLLSAGGAEVQYTLDFQDSACRVSTSDPCLLTPPLLQKHKQRAFEGQALVMDFQDTLELKETRDLFKVLGIGHVLIGLALATK